jgi:isoquinoline 1-oxidoreductase beta subunit
VATVVEVEAGDDGEIRIPRVVTALNTRLVVSPEATRAEFEGAAGFGTSIVGSGEITAKNGIIQQSNFNGYPVARINEVPAQTNVHITESSALPSGLGKRV